MGGVLHVFPEVAMLSNKHSVWDAAQIRQLLQEVVRFFYLVWVLHNGNDAELRVPTPRQLVGSEQRKIEVTRLHSNAPVGAPVVNPHVDDLALSQRSPWMRRVNHHPHIFAAGLLNDDFLLTLAVFAFGDAKEDRVRTEERASKCLHGCANTAGKVAHVKHR